MTDHGNSSFAATHVAKYDGPLRPVGCLKEALRPSSFGGRSLFLSAGQPGDQCDVSAPDFVFIHIQMVSFSSSAAPRADAKHGSFGVRRELAAQCLMNVSAACTFPAGVLFSLTTEESD